MSAKSFVLAPDARDLLDASRRIDRAILAMMTTLAGNAIARDLGEDLCEVAASSECVRLFAEQFLPGGDDEEPKPDDDSEIRGMVAASQGRPVTS